MSKIPDHFSKYFWDSDISSIDLKSHQQYIIARVLRYGDEASLKWIHQTFKRTDIRNCVYQSRELSLKDKTFFQLFY